MTTPPRSPSDLSPAAALVRRSARRSASARAWPPGWGTAAARPPCSRRARRRAGRTSDASERPGANERAAQAERGPQETVALQIDRRRRAAHADRDRATARALVELHRHEAADVHTVVGQDLAADLLAGERDRPQVVRHAAARVVGQSLRGIARDREVWPAVRAAPGVADPLCLEHAAHA